MFPAPVDTWRRGSANSTHTDTKLNRYQAFSAYFLWFALNRNDRLVVVDSCWNRPQATHFGEKWSRFAVSDFYFRRHAQIRAATAATQMALNGVRRCSARVLGGTTASGPTEDRLLMRS